MQKLIFSFLLVVIPSIIFAAGYQPNSVGISGGGTTCQNTAITLTGAVGAYKCANGGGVFESTGTITWYSSVDNSNATFGDDIAVFSEAFSTNSATTTNWTYNPDVASVGTMYYYYVITWSDNGQGGSCGPGTLTSGTQTVTVDPIPTIANAGPDQSPSDCSTSTMLGGNLITSGTGTWTVSPAGPTITSPNDPNSTVTGMVAGTAYTFTWTSVLGSCTSSDDMIFNSVGPGCLSPCTVTWSDPDDEYIDDVTFGASTLALNLGIGGYSDETGTCYSFTQGESYNLCIYVGNTGGPWTNNVHAFFDWDQDGVFEDDQDLGNQGGAGTICLNNFTIPCSSNTGSVLMRIVIAEGAAEPTSCTSGTYGDAADFCLDIVAATTPVAVASSVYVPCATSATLDATGSSITDGYWTLIDGSGTITDPTAQSTTITGLLNGNTTLQWTSTGTCDTDVDQTTFVVSGLPDEPVNAGIDAYTCTDPFVLDGSDPSPFVGAWQVISGPNVPSFSSLADPNASISGLVAGTYVLQWDVTTAVCGVVSDQVSVTFGSLPIADAGADQSGACPTNATLEGVPVAGLTSTWTMISGPSAAGFVDANDPGTITYDLVAGTYVFEYSLSGGGCPGSTTDQVQIDISSCVTAVSHNAVSNQEFTGCDFTYSDDGGTGGNYADNINQTWTTFCPDDPTAFTTLTFNTSSFYPGDWLVVYDDPTPGAPIVGAFYYDGSPGGGPVQNPALGTTITSSTGCLYVQMNSTATNNWPGFTADVGCSPTVGTQNQDFVTVNNCGGGGGITLCASGPVDAESNMDTNPPDLGNQNSGCLGSQEGASNTWVYMVAESDGWIAFQISPAGGQDFDYAIWGPYDGGYACPGSTLDDPIRCSWAANGGGAPCSADIGIGVVNTTGNPVLATDVSEGGFCATATNEGWTYPIYASTGDVYVLLFQNYGYNNSTFGFNINDDPSLIPPGESFASLGCDPPVALPISLISFTGALVGRQVNLYWNTASEYMNDFFTIERSRDGLNWEEIAIVDGAGFSTELSHYSTVDTDPYLGINYYRLVQTDFDGKRRSYKTIAISTEIETEGLFSEIYPNPTDGTFYFNYAGHEFKEDIVIRLFNSMGQLVMSKTYSAFNNYQSLEVETEFLDEGLYQVEITQGDSKSLKKVSVLR